MINKLSKILLFTFFIFNFSCKTDPCSKLVCQNGGVCSSGTCNCTEWYWGENCEHEYKEKYIGEYDGYLTYLDTGDQSVISCYVEDNNGLYNVQLFMPGLAINLSAEFTSTSNFNIPFQTVYNSGSGENDEYSGSGLISETQVNFNFKQKTFGTTYNLKFSGSK